MKSKLSLRQPNFILDLSYSFLQKGQMVLQSELLVLDDTDQLHQLVILLLLLTYMLFTH